MSSLLCRKITKTYGKTNTFGGIWYARQIILVIIIFLKTRFFLEILKMPSYSNIFQPETSFRTQIVDLENEDKKSSWLALVISSFFPMPESNWKFRMSCHGRIAALWWLIDCADLARSKGMADNRMFNQQHWYYANR